MNPEPATGPQAGPGSVPAEPSTLGLADLSFLTCLERTVLGETWTVRTSGGKTHLCQFVPPTEPATAAALLERLHSFRHRNLAPWMAVRGDGNRLAILAPQEGVTLRDRFQDLWDAKQPGIPREELLGYLHSAAVALEHLHARHQVQHLWLHPRQFMLLDDQVQIFGFGLVETWLPQTKHVTADLNPRYSAPELAHQIQGPQCDQYSLALIYAEMLTGTHPWRGRSLPAAARNPDLALLPDKDRAVIERALSIEPRQRFSSSIDMIKALEDATSLSVRTATLQSLVAVSGAAPVQLAHCTSLDQFALELAQLAAGKVKPPEEIKVRFALDPSKRLELPAYVNNAETALPVFDDFCRQWHAKAMLQGDDLVIMVINAAPSVWQWLTRRRVGLEIRLKFLPVAWGVHRTEVVIKPFGCDEEHAASLLRELGPKLLDSVRGVLHAQPEQRGLERHPVREKLRVFPVINGAAGSPIECYTKDVSAGGIGFFLPNELSTSQVYLSLPELSPLAPYSALAQIVRKQRTGDGWIEVGAAFMLGEKRPVPKM